MKRAGDFGECRGDQVRTPEGVSDQGRAAEQLVRPFPRWGVSRLGGPRPAFDSDWDRRVLLTLETRMMEHGNYWCAAEATEVSGRAA